MNSPEDSHSQEDTVKLGVVFSRRDWNSTAVKVKFNSLSLPIVLSKPLSLSWHNTNIPERPGPESLNIFCIFAVTKSYQIKLCQTCLERYLMFEMHLWQIPSRPMNLQRVNLKQILNLTCSPAMRSYHQFQEKKISHCEWSWFLKTLKTNSKIRCLIVFYDEADKRPNKKDTQP